MVNAFSVESQLRLCLAQCKIFSESKIFSGENIFWNETIFNCLVVFWKMVSSVWFACKMIIKKYV